MALFGFLRNYSILARMTVQGVLVVAGILALFVVNYWASEQVDNQRREAARFAAIRASAQTVEASGLRMRQAEKDFLLYKDIAFRDAYSEQFSAINRRLGDLQTSLAGAGRAIIMELTDNLSQHSAQFKVTAQTMVELGLTADQGLEGRLRTAVHTIEELLDQYVDKDLKILMLQMRRHEKDFIARLDPKYVDRIAKRRQEFLARLPETRFSNDVKARVRDLLESYVASFNEFAAKRLELTDQVAQLETIYQRGAPLYADITGLAQQGFDTANAELEAAQSTARVLNIIITLGALLVVGGGTLLIVVSTVRPIRDVSRAVASISAGDYQTEVPGTQFRDEMGAVSAAIANLRDSAAERLRLEQETAALKARDEELKREELERKSAAERASLEEQQQIALLREQRAKQREQVIADFETRVSKNLVYLSNASLDMLESAESMVAVAEKTGVSVDEVGTAAAAMNESVSHNMEAVSEFARSIAEVNNQVRIANDLCAETLERANEGAQSISAMSASADQVRGVISLINDIADQTNLLALNATIEAARAGEAGRGFAVVASEVKSLAQETAKATEQVANEVSAMEAKVDDTVRMMDAIRALIEKLSANMGGIASASEEQDATTREIERSTRVTAQSSESVGTVIGNVREDSVETRSISAKVKGAAEDLGKLGGNMSDDVTAFLDAVRKLATTTEASLEDEH